MITTTTTVTTEIVDDTGAVVARDDAPLTMFPGQAETLRQRLLVARPRRWSVDQPALYTCRTVVQSDGASSTTRRPTFGIRTIEVDPAPRIAHQRRSGRPARARASTTTTACSEARRSPEPTNGTSRS